MTELAPALSLAADFAPASREDWQKLVEAVLKGEPFERLKGSTYDGITVEPLAARRADARPIAARPIAAPWQMLARIDHPDPALANEAARNELANGATGLSLVFAGGAGDHGFGLPCREDTLARVLEGIDPDAEIAIELDLSPRAEAAVDAALAADIALSARTKHIRLGIDPLGAIALAERALRPWREQAPHFASRLIALAREGFSGPLAVADGRIIHNAGGSEAQELAFALAVALAYLRALEANGVALAKARGMIFFRLAADADQFLTLAKFRALRKLWARVEECCGLSAAPAFVSAETAWRMMARRDAPTDILRTTIAAFAAALGGADAITVLPFTVAIGLPEASARRIARNIQLMLLEETQLARVADPAAGSGNIEDLTDQLCFAAWRLFQEIEAVGGAAGALERGLIADRVTAVRAARFAALAQGLEAMTGVSTFAELNVASPLPSRQAEEEKFAPLASIRLAEPFEKLRDASDRYLAATGARPKVFLAALGAAVDYAARVAFAKNFFAVGGIEAVVGESLDPAVLANAFQASGALLACLCASHRIYASQAAAATQALNAAGARHIYLVGRPQNQDAAVSVAGVESFIYEHCDALATLHGAYDILGIAIG